MKNNYKLLILVLVLIFLLVLFNKIISFNDISYSLSVDNNKFKIKETRDDGNYYIEIDSGKYIYPIRIYNDLNNQKKIIKGILFYRENNLECILPVIDDKIYTDFMCYKDSILYNYHNIRGTYDSLDNYVSSIKLYNTEKYQDTPSKSMSIGNIEYNFFDNFKNTIAITTYKGLVINGEELNIFKNDIYNNKISVFVDKYYLVADYESEYSFSYFYLINLLNKEVVKLANEENISYDSYIQGIVDGKVYLYDKDNEAQYEINVYDRKINLVSSNNYVNYYSKGKWTKINKAKANKVLYFDYSSLDNNFTDYDYVKDIGNYYYLFKKDGISYKLYRVDKNNLQVYKYLIEVPTTNIEFKEDFLYYVYKNKLYYYSDNLGFKTILQDLELEFNDTIKYYIY